MLMLVDAFIGRALSDWPPQEIIMTLVSEDTATVEVIPIPLTVFDWLTLVLLLGGLIGANAGVAWLIWRAWRQRRVHS